MLNLRNLAISKKLWLLTLLTTIGLIAITALALERYQRDLMKEKLNCGPTSTRRLSGNSRSISM